MINIFSTDTAAANVSKFDVKQLSSIKNELYEASHNCVLTDTINDFIRKYVKEFDDYFLKVLEKLNITKEQWLSEGYVSCDYGVHKCYYRGKCIFCYTEPKLDQIKIPDNIKSYKSEFTGYMWCPEEINAN